MVNLWHCIVGPRLFRIYELSKQIQSGENTVYSSNGFERFGDNFIKGINVLWNIGIYTSPFIVAYLYKKDYLCYMGCVSLGRFATGIGFLLVVGLIIRGLGRYINKPYTDFLHILHETQNDGANMNTLRKYDFDFWAWPTDFSVKEVEGDESKPFTQVEHSASKGKVGPILWLLGLPCNLAAFLCIHSFGRHLIFPGSIHILQSLMKNMLEDGREKLIGTHNGSRNKILTRDGNHLDTLFIDRRKSASHSYGSTLVVCCEGNAGFYEVGLMYTPLEAGYSVLGWNHPGFAGSSGAPFPPQEQHAIDSVMQFAIHKLGFKVEDIIIYAWSIGGYSGTWAAMNYPQVRGLILDASFDDILPLALPRMPSLMGGIVKSTIRQYMNLNVADQLCRYPGPLTLIRRTNDEIITTTEGDLSTNRGNNILIKLLQYRYPNLYDSTEAADTLRQWISEDNDIQDAIYGSKKIDEELLLTQLVSFIEEHGESYPISLGKDMNDNQKTQMLLFIARKILVNFNSSHNNPLETQYFKVPWTPMTDPSFVQV